MIIKKKVSVVKEEDVWVSKENAKDVIKHISKSNPYYKFVKALSQGKNVFADGKDRGRYKFDLPPSEYTIETPFDISEWYLILIQKIPNGDFTLHRIHYKTVAYMDNKGYKYNWYRFINKYTILEEEFKSLPIEK